MLGVKITYWRGQSLTGGATMGLSEKQLRDLAERLRDTARSIDAELERMEVRGQDVTDIESDLLDHDAELCLSCGFWCSPGELEDSICESCR